jgi:hypothetical protein
VLSTAVSRADGWRSHQLSLSCMKSSPGAVDSSLIAPSSVSPGFGPLSSDACSACEKKERKKERNAPVLSHTSLVCAPSLSCRMVASFLFSFDQKVPIQTNNGVFSRLTAPSSTEKNTGMHSPPASRVTPGALPPPAIAFVALLYAVRGSALDSSVSAATTIPTNCFKDAAEGPLQNNKQQFSVSVSVICLHVCPEPGWANEQCHT